MKTAVAGRWTSDQSHNCSYIICLITYFYVTGTVGVKSYSICVIMQFLVMLICILFKWILKKNYANTYSRSLLFAHCCSGWVRFYFFFFFFAWWGRTVQRHKVKFTNLFPPASTVLKISLSKLAKNSPDTSTVQRLHSSSSIVLFFKVNVFKAILDPSKKVSVKIGNRPHLSP